MTNERIVLAIESAIGGGSISLQRGGIEIDHWLGNGKVSKAEDVLANIQKILAANSYDLKNLDVLAVSTGPGSYTGIRIGLATAYGLASACDLNPMGISTLAAMARSANVTTTRVLVALPIGREAICVQYFSLVESGKLTEGERWVFSKAEFFGSRPEPPVTIVTTDSLHGEIMASGENNPKIQIRDLGPNLAKHIGTAATDPNTVGDLTPIFVSPHGDR